MGIRKWKSFGIALSAMAGSCALCSSCAGGGVVSLNGLSPEELAREAAKERYLYTIAMPDTWTNWGETWDDLETKFQIHHQDTDMSSVEELEIFRAQREGATKDIGDVGRSYAVQAEKERLLLKYKTSYWDEIPDWAKDDDGDWIISYTGNISFLINTDRVKAPPLSWQDVREGDYRVTIGDVISGVQSQYAVIASAYAFGGDLEHLRPGIEFWKELAEKGRLDKMYSRVDRIAAGETDVAVLMDFNSLNYRKQALEQDPGLNLKIVIPSDGSVSLGYSTIISRYAAHPHAAALAREYILSDEGQINLARGYARPIRGVELPADVRAGMIPEEEYENIINLEDERKIEKALKEIKAAWENEIIPLY